MRSRIQNYRFVYNGQPDPTRPISLTLTQTPQPQLTAWSQFIAAALGHSTVWADFVSVSGSVLSQRQEQQKLQQAETAAEEAAAESVRCAVQNSKLWVCIIGSVSVFLPL